MPASAILSSSSSSAKATVADVAPIQGPAWDTDDLIMAAGEPMPRVVFLGAPSFDEAKEATVELKDALDECVQIFLILFLKLRLCSSFSNYPLIFGFFFSWIAVKLWLIS